MLPLLPISAYVNEFPLHEYPFDPQGFTTIESLVHSVFMETNPKRVLEVGVWKGYSARHWLDNNPTCTLMCVDTWLGAKEMYTIPDPNRELYRQFGYPKLYHRFLANMIHLGYQDRVTPFPLHSQSALEALEEAGYRFDFAYIDASHEYNDVAGDIERAARICPVLTGDDYNSNWPGVIRAVDEFVERVKPKRFETDGRGWVICL